MTIDVTSVVPSFTPSPNGGPTLDPSTHLVLIDIRVTASTPTSLPPTGFSLRGPGGQPLSVDLVEGGEMCEGIGGGITALPANAAAASLCFDIASAAFTGFTLSVALPHGGQLRIPLSSP